jgi:hypothetical protein
MRIHCDGCGRALEKSTAIARKVDEDEFFFCSEACARASRHLADEVYTEEDGHGTGPIAPGDADEPAPPPPKRGPAR